MSRMAMFVAGLPSTVPIYAVNRQCASGLQAIACIAASIDRCALCLAFSSSRSHLSFFLHLSLPLHVSSSIFHSLYMYVTHLSLYTSLLFSFSTLPFWSDFTSYNSRIQFWIFCCPSAQFHFTSLTLSYLDALVRFMGTSHFYTNLFTSNLTVPYERNISCRIVP